VIDRPVDEQLTYTVVVAKPNIRHCAGGYNNDSKIHYGASVTDCLRVHSENLTAMSCYPTPCPQFVAYWFLVDTSRVLLLR